MYPCCSTEDVPAPAMAIPDHPSDVRDGMVQHKGQDNIPPRNTVPFAQPSFPARCDGDDLPACAIGNDFREANTRRWKLRSSRAQPLSSNPMMGWTRRDGHLSQSNWTSHPPRPRSPMPNDRASILSCRVLQRRRWMLPDDAWMLGFASDHVAAPKCVCERHCHRSGCDRSAHETRRAGGMDQFPTRGGVLVAPWVLSFSAQTTARWARCRYRADRRHAGRPEAAVVHASDASTGSAER